MRLQIATCLMDRLVTLNCSKLLQRLPECVFSSAKYFLNFKHNFHDYNSQGLNWMF